MINITDTYQMSTNDKGRIKFEINYILLAKYCIEKFRILNYQDCLFIEIDGIYTRDFTANLIKSKISEVLIDEIGLSPNGELLGEINTTLAFIKLVDVQYYPPFNTENGILNCEDGILKLDFENKRVERISNEDSKYKFTYKLPIVYNPEVSTDAAEKFFSRFDEEITDKKEITEKEITDDSKDKKIKNSDLLLQIPAHVILQVCFPQSTYKYAHIIHSDPNCGKTSLINLIGLVFGNKNCASEELENVCNGRFTLSALYGKIINKFDDLPKKPVDVGRFKSITGGGEVSVEFKGVKPFNTRLNAVHIYTANAIPHLTSADIAFWERFIYIHLTRQFKKDSMFETNLYTPEFLQSCFNLFVKTAFKIYENGNDLIGQDTHLQMMSQSFMDSNLVHKFVCGNCYKLTNSIISRNEFYDKLAATCVDKYKISPDMVPSPQKIADYMRNSGYSTEEDKKEVFGKDRLRCWYNIAWKDIEPTFKKIVSNDKDAEMIDIDGRIIKPRPIQPRYNQERVDPSALGKKPVLEPTS